MSGDIPRVPFGNIISSEILTPLVLVAVTSFPYLFLCSQFGQDDLTEDDRKQTLIRLMIVALAPVAVNAGVAFFFFALACCAGPLLGMCCKKFGPVLAAIAHAIAVIMLFIFYIVMYFLSGYSFTKALAGMIAVVHIQRWFYKLLICLALTREFKHDQSNIAFWTGQWYGMGLHAITQPGRELVCKITELGFFANDFILGHFLLFVQLPAILVPYIDTAHSTMLFWLRPSRQIRPPIYSAKQTKLRKRRVIRFASLYFAVLVFFLIMSVGPIIANKFKIFPDYKDLTKGNAMLRDFMQPPNQDGKSKEAEAYSTLAEEESKRLANAAKTATRRLGGN
jgi:1,3-beta-glucan synthase